MLKPNVASIPRVWRDRTDKLFVYAMRSVVYPWSQFVAATGKRTSTNVIFELMLVNNDEALPCYSVDRVVSYYG